MAAQSLQKYFPIPQTNGDLEILNGLEYYLRIQIQIHNIIFDIIVDWNRNLPNHGKSFTTPSLILGGSMVDDNKLTGKWHVSWYPYLKSFLLHQSWLQKQQRIEKLSGLEKASSDWNGITVMKKLLISARPLDLIRDSALDSAEELNRRMQTFCTLL